MTIKKIEAATEAFRGQLGEFSERLNAARSYQERALAQFQLALTYNQLAWLISNTEGDYDEALRSSIKSLELQPGRSGFLDTLGRCYYAKGDYQNAVKFQSQAVALEPNSPLIVKQLKLFEEALQKQNASDAGANTEETAAEKPAS
jgi:tetratricopeptide (TPR) repeat protein